MANLYQAAAGIDRLERLAMEDSPIHRLHPMPKLITTIIYVSVVISFSSKNISGLMPLFFYPIIMISLADIPYRILWRRMMIALPFALMGGLSNILFVHETVFYIGNSAISFGMLSFASIMLKTLLTVSSVLILIATTSFVEIIHQLAVLRIPKVLCLQLVMMYRYLSVLLGEASTMWTAYALRAPRQKGIRMKDMGNFLGQLMLRSFDRADRVYQAMKCRGFQGMYYGKKRSGLCLSDWVYTITLSIVMLILRILNVSILLEKLVR